MKNTDKVTLTVGQLKKLINENFNEDFESIYNDRRWIVTYREQYLMDGYPIEHHLVINAKDKREVKDKFNLYAERDLENEKKYYSSPHKYPLEFVSCEPILYID